MGVLLHDRNGISKGFAKCFTCGWTGTIKQIFRHLGYEYVERTTSAPTGRPAYLDIRKTYYKNQLPYSYSPYLADRGIDSHTQQRFKIYQKDSRVYMPVFARDGKYLYVSSRDTQSKRYYIEAGASKTLAYIEEVDFSKPVWVVEGQIDALSLWRLGIQAVAMLSATNTAALTELIDARQIVIALDNDAAGREGALKAQRVLGAFRCMFLDLPSGADINDLLVDGLQAGKAPEFIRQFMMSRLRHELTRISDIEN
jgi:hypothetical protein